MSVLRPITPRVQPPPVRVHTELVARRERQRGVASRAPSLNPGRVLRDDSLFGQIENSDAEISEHVGNVCVAREEQNLLLIRREVAEHGRGCGGGV